MDRFDQGFMCVISELASTHDQALLEVTVSYDRPETDEEEKLRERDVQANIDNREQSERSELARLKQKYDA